MIWKDSLLSLGEAVAAVAMAQKLLLEARSLRLFTHIPEGLPPLFADRDRIQQVITNLLSNAIKFSPAGREIRIWAKPLEGKRSGDRADWLLVGVSDQGVGIAAQDQEAVFKKFKQVCTDTLTDKPEGSGLGLPICKEIVAHYGGNIWVESKKGEGSTFFFTLPSASPSQRTGLASKSATSHTQREEKGDHACGE